MGEGKGGPQRSSSEHLLCLGGQSRQIGESVRPAGPPGTVGRAGHTQIVLVPEQEDHGQGIWEGSCVLTGKQVSHLWPPPRLLHYPAAEEAGHAERQQAAGHREAQR